MLSGICFPYRCLQQWLNQHNTCPMCKTCVTRQAGETTGLITSAVWHLTPVMMWNINTSGNWHVTMLICGVTFTGYWHITHGGLWSVTVACNWRIIMVIYDVLPLLEFYLLYDPWWFVKCYHCWQWTYNPVDLWSIIIAGNWDTVWPVVVCDVYHCWPLTYNLGDLWFATIGGNWHATHGGLWSVTTAGNRHMITGICDVLPLLQTDIIMIMVICDVTFTGDWYSFVIIMA